MGGGCSDTQDIHYITALYLVLLPYYDGTRSSALSIEYLSIVMTAPRIPDERSQPSGFTANPARVYDAYHVRIMQASQSDLPNVDASQAQSSTALVIQRRPAHSQWS